MAKYWRHVLLDSWLKVPLWGGSNVELIFCKWLAGWNWMCVCLAGCWCFCVGLWFAWSQRRVSPIRRWSSWLPLACWTMSEDPLLSDGQISERVCVCVRSVSFGCVPFVCHPKAVCGCRSKYACVGWHPCTQVQRCEIRWWFVEGDNEQSAILTGWALRCQWQPCSPRSGFNQSKHLLFFYLNNPGKKKNSRATFLCENLTAKISQVLEQK